jgi:subtilisin family serine protease
LTVLRRLLVVVLLALAAAPSAAAARFSLVEARPAARPFLTLSGAREIAPSIGMWRVATSDVPQLRAAGLVRYAQAERRLRPAVVRRSLLDPLESQEWWLPDIGAAQATPPGPGVPITVVDTGIDLTHPEFAGRPNTVALNTQSVVDSNEDFHGTAVASVAAAPENGAGIVGVYPQAVLHSYDADLSGDLTDSDIIDAIEASIAVGPSVINLSLGGTEFDPALQDEIYSAFRHGSLVVAASGNSRDEGNPANFPADMAHVLTVAATTQTDSSAFFSSSSDGVDLAAPGVGILSAVPLRYSASGYEPLDGTSFSAPMVSAAAAWVWTARPTLDVTQLFDVMRLSARDIETPGFDAETGFGLLNIPAALAYPTPLKDPEEPNDDIDLVKPGALFPTGEPPLTTPAKRNASIHARLDFTEDPDDVYRIWVPAGYTATVSVSARTNVALQLWRPTTHTVLEMGAAKLRDLAASVKKTAKTATLGASNRTKAGAFYYADVFAQTGNPSYDLSVRTAKTKTAKR